VGFFVTETNAFPRITALLTAHGHSPDEAAAIVLFARRKHARQWIRALVGVAASRARYQQTLKVAFPPVPLTESAEHA
jgi:hypothetical protein